MKLRYLCNFGCRIICDLLCGTLRSYQVNYSVTQNNLNMHKDCNGVMFNGYNG